MKKSMQIKIIGVKSMQLKMRKLIKNIPTENSIE